MRPTVSGEAAGKTAEGNEERPRMEAARQAPRSRGARAKITASRNGADDGPRNIHRAAVMVLTAPTEPGERTEIRKDPARKLGTHVLADRPAADHPVNTE